MGGALAELLRGGLRAELEPTGILRIRGTLSDPWRTWIRAHRDIVISELRVADQDEAGLRHLISDIADDLATVHTRCAVDWQAHVEELLQTDPEAARAEIARCWTALVRCQMPNVAVPQPRDTGRQNG